MVETLNARNDPKTVDIVNVEDEEEDKENKDDEDYTDDDSDSLSLSGLPKFTLDDLDYSDIEDIDMDSASNSVSGKPPGDAADKGTIWTAKVHWSTASSVDESAHSPAAGSG